MSAARTISRPAPDRAAASRTNALAVAPGTPPQKTPRAPDTPWGRLRGTRRWSLRHLSELTGINIADLSRIERGISAVTPEQAQRLLKTYGMAT